MRRSTEDSPARMISVAISSQIVKHAPFPKDSVHIAPRETASLRRFKALMKKYSGKAVFAGYRQSDQ
jgi:hypothetical protein